LSYEDFERAYRGNTRYLQVTDSTGKQVRFAATHLRPYLTRDGVKGSFILRYDGKNKFQSLEKISD
jgi:hypothetical protein